MHTIFKYTRALQVSATTYMVQLTTIHNGIGYTLIGIQGSLANTKQSLAQWHMCQPHMNNYLALSRLATIAVQWIITSEM